LTALATSTVFVPGWRLTAMTIDRCWNSDVQNQAATLSFSTLSRTDPSAPRRTGAPLRYVTISGR
jgi:hypothetical protein